MVSCWQLSATYHGRMAALFYTAPALFYTTLALQDAA
jgi:hypothetical protein